MKPSKFSFAGLSLATMLCAGVLATTPVNAATTDTEAAQTTSQSATSTSSSANSTEATKTTEQSETPAAQAEVAPETKVTQESASAVGKEADVQQTIEIHQVKSTQKTKAGTMANTTYKGVNGASWTVYDVTDELKGLLKAGETDKDLSATDVQGDLETKLSNKSYNTDKLKKYSSGVTKKVAGVDGIFDVAIKVPAHQYKALLFKNTNTPEYITKAEQFVLIVPLSDANGKLPAKMVIQPKSADIPQPKPKTPAPKILPQLGDAVKQFLPEIGAALISAAGGLAFWRHRKTAAKSTNKNIEK